jgi:hypothetical protein
MIDMTFFDEYKQRVAAALGSDFIKHGMPTSQLDDCILTYTVICYLNKVEPKTCATNITTAFPQIKETT